MTLQNITHVKIHDTTLINAEGDLVLDNTAGSSTTAIACIKTGRNWIMIEKEEEYYNLSLKRIEYFLNEKIKT